MSLQVLPLSTSEWPRHGKPETEFLQGLLHSGSRWGVFLQLPRLLASTPCPDEAPEPRGECEPVVLAGAHYRHLLHAKPQAGHP